MSFALFVSALEVELRQLLPQAQRLGLTPSEAWNVLVVRQLREVLLRVAAGHGLRADGKSGRLLRSVPGFERDGRAELRERCLRELGKASDYPELPGTAPLSFGQLYESLLAARPAEATTTLRKRTGSYYTPEALTKVVAKRAFEALERSRGGGASTAAQGAPPTELRVVDPAMGAGAFLVRAGLELAERSGRALASVVRHELFGVDVSPLAVAVAEASLWLLAANSEMELGDAGGNLREADALCSPDAAAKLGRVSVDFDELLNRNGGFDLVIGNPPWVAFAGRATQPLPPPLRAYFRRNFRSFSGYPTLHALFVELGARIAPRGVVALLIPSPLADLDGYRHVRRVLGETHRPEEPLLELGQDAFESVTQPCFALVATPRATLSGSSATATDTLASANLERPWVLTERSRAANAAAEVATPVALARLGTLPRLPAELFGEMGLQTSSAVTKQLLYRGSTPPPEYNYALLEGRNIAEFSLSQPRLFLKPDRELLARFRCRLRERAEYQKVKLVVRQTAAITIAAGHDGTPFRNSLLAGFELPEFPAALTLGLLNSTLYRALHLAGRRDARQGAFPQVKIAHLRSLPAPPAAPSRSRIAELADHASRKGLTIELREALDRTVFALFGIEPEEAQDITTFVKSRAPRAGLITP